MAGSVNSLIDCLRVTPLSGSKALHQCIKKALQDNLSNLLGPWDPYIPDAEEGEGALEITDTLQLIERGLEEDRHASASQASFPGDLRALDHLSIDN